MSKQEFLLQLKEGLCGFPQDGIDEYLDFYGEMIDDRIEEGLSEEQAINEIGSVEKVVEQILEDTPFIKLVKEKIKPKRRLQTWEIVLLAVGSPVWVSLLVAVASVIFSVCVAFWAVIISLWAAWFSVAAGAVGGIVGGAAYAAIGYTFTGLALCGASLVCLGVSVFLFFGCKTATKGILLLTKRLALGIKSCFVRKERAI